MKILYLTQLLPWPLDTGGKIKSYKTIKTLAKKHQVYLVCFVHKTSELKHKKQLEKICKQVKVFVWPLTRLGFKKLIPQVFLNFFSFTPFIFYRYHCLKMKKYVEKIIQKEEFDAIHIDHLNMLQYLPKKKRCLWILEEHNIESQGKLSIARHERFPINIVFFWEAVRLWLKEIFWFRKFDHILAISGKDKKNIINKGTAKNRILVLPTPMEASNLYFWGKKNLLFIGLLSWWPNKDALVWFVKEIYPVLKPKITNLKFFIIGDDPQPKLKRLTKNDKSVVYSGYVKDIKPYLKRAGCFIVPFRMGSGARIKLLTAMAAGIPVVGSKKGFEGFLTPEKIRGLLVTNQKQKVINYIVKVFEDKKFALSISQKQLELIEKYYCQTKQKKILEKIYG